MAKERVDSMLVARGLCDSREQAKRLIMAGEVFTESDRVAKPSQKMSDEVVLRVRDRPKYVGRVRSLCPWPGSGFQLRLQ